MDHKLEPMVGRVLDLSGLRQGQAVGACEYGYEPSHSIQCGELLDLLRNCQLLK